MTRKPGNKRINQPHIVVVEGTHDQNFFEAWIKFLLKQEIQIMEIGGKSSFADKIKGVTNTPGFDKVERLLIVRDADDNPIGAFQSACHALNKAELPVPHRAFEFTQGQVPYTSVAIIPAAGPEQKGALEELLMQTADSDPIASMATQFIDDATQTLIQTGHRSPPPTHRQGKARVHAFLATFKDPDKDMGKAALAGVWDFSHAALDPLRALLQHM